VCIRAVFGAVVALLFSLGLALPAVATVRQTSSGICHPPESRYYDGLRSYTPHQTLQECLNSGGRMPANYQPANSQPVQAPAANAADDGKAGYQRSEFGSGWADEDGNCRDSRQEALVAQSTGPVRFKGQGAECQVSAGRWISPFTGNVIHDPSAIDIDHVVPLKWAWNRGASNWSREQRIRFANDPVNLLSVEASLNRQKGAKGPDEWLPPAGQCQYIARFLRVTHSYGLTLADAETQAYQQIKQSACRLSRSEQQAATDH